MTRALKVLIGGTVKFLKIRPPMPDGTILVANRTMPVNSNPASRKLYAAATNRRVELFLCGRASRDRWGPQIALASPELAWKNMEG
jgi:hypothetical protein